MVKKAVRIIVPAIYAFSFAYMAEELGTYYAHKERGYEAFGGEYIFCTMVFVGVYLGLRFMFKILED